MEQLLDPKLNPLLQKLHYSVRRPVQQGISGERRSARRGDSVEFSGYRDYVPGDDLRNVDWKAYGRLERMYLKTFIADEDLTVSILVDASRSMDFGTVVTKLEYARRLAAGLAFIGLNENDRVNIGVFADGLKSITPNFRGRAGIAGCFRSIENIAALSEITSTGAALASFSHQAHSGSLCFVLSDFLDRTVATGLRALAAAHNQVVLVQILDPAEVDPGVSGEMRLIDSETGRDFEVTVTQSLRERYDASLSDLKAFLARETRRYGMDLVSITTATDPATIYSGSLRTMGVVR